MVSNGPPEDARARALRGGQSERKFLLVKMGARNRQAVAPCGYAARDGSTGWWGIMPLIVGGWNSLGDVVGADA